jgi:phosphate uptake regulator
MKIKIEIVDDELKSISNDYVKYIDVENYQHTKDFHTESVLEEMADDILTDIKWDLAKPKK